MTQSLILLGRNHNVVKATNFGSSFKYSVSQSLTMSLTDCILSVSDR